MYRVGLSGTNWTGKTETIRQFIEEHSEITISKVSLSSLVDKCPFPMKEEQTLAGSQWMIEQVEAICKKDSGEIQLFDRTPVDILAFALYAQSRTGNTSQEVLENCINIVKYFDILFYLPVSGEWPLNECTNQKEIQFARKMDSYIRKAIEDFSLDIIWLPWELTERQRFLSEHLPGLSNASKA